MFNKLRNKLIVINLGITSVVILTTFTAIYLVSARTADNRPAAPENVQMMVDDDSEGVRDYIIFTMREERKLAASTLLITLVVSGIAIEIVVALISYFLAEEAIKPVREAYESQKIFIANASHEIKTPLAAISANLEAADIHENKWISNVEVEAAKLAALNNELLTLARTDLVADKQIETCDLAAVARKMVSGFEPRLADKKLTVKIDLAHKVKINRADFEQILSILMDNAVKYSDQWIRVSLTDRQLTVENDGKTIAREKLPHIFERFYQADKSAEGVGLGLSIAKSLADRNKWSLKANSGSKTTSFALNY